MLNLSKSTVAYHARRVGLPADDRCARRYDWEQVQRAVDAGASRVDCLRAFGFSSCTWYEAVKAGRIEPRDHRIPLEDLLVVGRDTNRTHLKARLFGAGLKLRRCETCGIAEWLGRPLGLALHHVTGDPGDNRLDNLQILCPNCHSQTPNFGSKNKRRSDPRSARA